LRMFPIYFVILGSLAVYLFARNITKDSFLGLIASAAFLVTPAMLVVSSRFSLQQDLSFVFVLSATFYFLSEIVGRDGDANGGSGSSSTSSNKKPAKKIYFLMLIVCLSLLPLVRELGLIISLAILFLVLAIKFTYGNIKLRALFSVLSFLPFYVLSFYDLSSNGFTNTVTVRLITLITANIAVFYILTKVNKNQNRFTSSINIRRIRYLIPFVIPLIFISSNMIMFSGPYPAIIFSNEFIESGASWEGIFSVQNDLHLNLSQALQKYLPRIDLLFTSIAMGSIFLFFKLYGLGRLLQGLKSKNYQYALILILLIFLLVTWSYLLGSGFESSNIRHIAYFVPLLSVILVVGMTARKKILPSAIPSSSSSLSSQKQQLHYKLFSYGIIVLATFYFLSYSLYTWNYDNHFGGFWIEPNKSSFMTLPDLRLGIALIAALILLQVLDQQISLRLKKYNLQRYLAFAFMALLAVQIYILSSSLSSSGRVRTAPIERIDQIPPSQWEEDVFEVITYLNGSESGNVLSFRAPAISFFTNRTNYDLYNPHTFSSFISSLLSSGNSTILKQKISEMAIRYIVLPNERNNLNYLVENIMPRSSFIDVIETDDDFRKSSLSKFDIYEYNPT
jgi:hypothetical protein